MEGIGIVLDPKGERMFLTDLAGSLYSANLDGSDKKILLELEGNHIGVAYTELPAEIAWLSLSSVDMIQSVDNLVLL